MIAPSLPFRYTPRIAILKIDDFGFPVGLENFRRLAEIAFRNKISISIGAVAASLRNLSSRELSYVRGIVAAGDVEIWSHSFMHPDLTRLDYTKQREDIEKAQEIIEQNLGVRPNVFGAPYNKYNQDTLTVLREIGDFSCVYLPPQEIGAESDGRISFIPRSTLISPEFVRETERQCEFDEFVRRVRVHRDPSLLTVQVHPPAWNEHDFEVIERVIQYLLEGGYRFVTAEEYHSYLKFCRALQVDAPTNSGMADFSNLSPNVQSLIVDSIADQVCICHRENNEKPLIDFFYNRFRKGTQSILRVFRNIGFDKPSAANGAEFILDVGCGSGAWGVAYSLLHPQAHVLGLDISLAACELAQAVVENCGLAHRIEVKQATIEDLAISDKKITRAWSSNALQYMDMELFFDSLLQRLKYQAQFYFSAQSHQYFISNAISAAEAGDMKLAIGRLNTILWSEAYRLGWTNTPVRVRSHRRSDIVRAARYCGFQMVVERIQAEKDATFRESLLVGFLAQAGGAYLPSLKQQLAAATPAQKLELLKSLFVSACPRKILQLHSDGAIDFSDVDIADLVILSRVKADQALDAKTLKDLRNTVGRAISRSVLSFQLGDFAEAAAELEVPKSEDEQFLKCLALYMSNSFAECRKALVEAKASSASDLRLEIIGATLAFVGGDKDRAINGLRSIPLSSLDLMRDDVVRVNDTKAAANGNTALAVDVKASGISLEGTSVIAQQDEKKGDSQLVSRGMRPGSAILVECQNPVDLQIPESPLFELRVTRRGVPFEYLVNVKPRSKALVVFGQSALATRSDMILPLYHRWTWFDDLPEVSCIAVNDPTLYINPSLMGGWFQGTADHFYAETGAAIIGELARKLGFDERQIILYGSSAGGFASMMMSTELKQASVVAEIPQIDMTRYHVKSAVDNLLNHSYGGITLDEARERFADRWIVTERFRRKKHLPNIMYIQNLADQIHIDRHLTPFLSSIEKLWSEQPSLQSNRFLLEYFYARSGGGDGHFPAPRPFIVRCLRTAMEAFLPR